MTTQLNKYIQNKKASQTKQDNMRSKCMYVCRGKIIYNEFVFLSFVVHEVSNLLDIYLSYGLHGNCSPDLIIFFCCFFTLSSINI